MVKMSQFHVLVSISFLVIQPIFSDVENDITKGFSDFIAKTYIDAHLVETIKKEAVVGKSSFLAQIDSRYKDVSIPAVENRAAYETAFSFVGDEFYKRFPAGSSQQLSPTTIKKMELFAGGENSASDYSSWLFSEIKTFSGIAWAAHQLTNPIVDAGLLRKRQRIISFLLEKPALLQDLTNLFEHAHCEKQLLFFGTQETLSTATDSMFYFPSKFDFLNKTEITFELKRFLQLFSASTVPIIIPSTFGIVAWTVTRNQYATKLDALKHLPGNVGTMIKEFAALAGNASFANKLRIAYMAAIVGLSQGMQLSKISLEILVAKELQKILIDVARYLDIVRNIGELGNVVLEQHPDMHEYLPSLQHIIDLDNTAKHSNNFNYVVSALNSRTFKGKESAFSRIGRILKVYKLLPSVIHEFKPIIAAVGELDCYLALTKKISQSGERKNNLSFAEFVNYGPTVQARSFWNPFVLYHKEYVIPNNFHLSDDGVRNIVITGPNTGGKSTILKGLFLNVLLAQTFGLAAADKFVISPFSLINCYLNITDDISEGVSLFKAEVSRAKELLKGIRSLDSHQFAFTIMDEVFTGTASDQGEKAAKYYAGLLNEQKNSGCVLATHYSDLTKMVGYRNMHVEVLRNADNTLTFTFKLKDGPSFMNIAMDLLMQEGIA